MKNKYFVLYLFMFLPLLVIVFTLPFLPDLIPGHYDINGNIDRWGSKYEQLILPIFTIAFGLFMRWIAKLSAKKENNASNEKVMIIIGLSSVILFNILCYIFLYKAYFGAVGADEPIIADINQIMFIVMGVMFCFMGNIMPKCRRNSIVGLRTKWSMANDDVWFKSQRFGGITFIISGLIIITGNLFLKNIACLIFSMSVLSVDLILSIIGSYYIYKKDITSR